MSEVNYTEAQVAELKALAPMNFEQATAWGVLNGKKGRSVVSKILSEEFAYIKKEVPAPKAKEMTKAQIVALIEAKLAPETKLAGLEKATVAALSTLHDALPA